MVISIAYDVLLVTLMEPTPCYSQSQAVFACQSFTSVAPLFFSGKSTIFSLCEYRKRCGHIDMLMTFPW